MALSAGEKTLMRMALCDGAFAEVQGPVTPQILTTIATLDDESVRVVLRAYKVRKLEWLQSNLTRVSDKATALNSDIEDITSITVA